MIDCGNILLLRQVILFVVARHPFSHSTCITFRRQHVAWAGFVEEEAVLLQTVK